MQQPFRAKRAHVRAQAWHCDVCVGQLAGVIDRIDDLQDALIPPLDDLHERRRRFKMHNAGVDLRAPPVQIAGNLHDAENGQDASTAGHFLRGTNAREIGDGQPGRRIVRVAGVMKIQRVHEHLEAPRLGHHLVEQDVVREIRRHQLAIAEQPAHHVRMVAQNQNTLPLFNTDALFELGVVTPKRKALLHK